MGRLWDWVFLFHHFRWCFFLSPCITLTSVEADCRFLESGAFRKFHVGWRVCVSASQLWIRREPQHDRYYDTKYTPEIEDGRRAYPTVSESSLQLPKLEMHIRRCVSLVTKRWRRSLGTRERKGIFFVRRYMFFLPCRCAEGQKTCSMASDWTCPRGSLKVCVALAAIHIHWLFEEPMAIVAEKKLIDFSSLGLKTHLSRRVGEGFNVPFPSIPNIKSWPSRSSGPNIVIATRNGLLWNLGGIWPTS